MTKTNYLKIIKIAFGSAAAFLIADWLGLKFSSAAALIALLSIQDTKKETLKIFLKRVYSFAIAMTVSYIVFEMLGYNPVSFGVFLLIFVYISYKAKLFDGISLNSVLVSHFLSSSSITLSTFANEAALFMIGSLTALILNLYIPTNIKEIKEMQEHVEEKMRKILLIASMAIIEDKKISNEECFDDLDHTLRDISEQAYRNMNNTLIRDTRYYLNYVDMRQNQVIILKKIYNSICKMTSIPKQCNDISEILTTIGLTFQEKNNAHYLLEGMVKLKESMKHEELPKSREEFENRAILFNIMIDLESFLLLKYGFINELSKEDIDMYWSKM